MWSLYNYTNFPVVHVSFHGNLNKQEKFNDFINKWKQLYEERIPFSFVFDTKECGYVNIKYCFRMSSFIKELKRKQKQYLQKSIIIYYRGWIKYLLQLTFSIQSPVAPVYLVNGNDNKEDTIRLLNNNIIPNNVIIYLP
jgi:hypothetical protein